MKKTDMLTMLRMIFNNLSDSAKVEIMTEFYYDYLDDYRKDEFLRETENA
jgi:hypothetical protein